MLDSGPVVVARAVVAKRQRAVFVTSQDAVGRDEVGQTSIPLSLSIVRRRHGISWICGVCVCVLVVFALKIATAAAAVGSGRADQPKKRGNIKTQKRRKSKQKNNKQK